MYRTHPNNKIIIQTKIIQNLSQTRHQVKT